eukprot:1296294-Prymnesium_polylepis.1
MLSGTGGDPFASKEMRSPGSFGSSIDMPCTICGRSERLPNEPICIGIPSFGWTVAMQERATSVTKGGMTVKLSSLRPGENSATCCAEKAAPSMS